MGTPMPSKGKVKKTKGPKPSRGGKKGSGGGRTKSRPSKGPKSAEHEEFIAAVDMNGSTVRTTGYSLQTEIVGFLSIATVLLICAYSMMCRRQKESEYEEIADNQAFV